MSMKLAFSTLPFGQCDAQEICRVIEKYGIDGVEVRAAQDGSFVYSESFNITNLGSGITLLGYDEKQMETAREIFKSANEKKIPAVRIFLGNFAVRRDATRKELDYEGIVRAIRELAELNLAQVWIETHNEFATGKTLRKLLDDIHHPGVKVIWDIVHPIEDEETPQETLDWLGKDIAHVHIKDGKKHPDPIMHDYYYTKLGEGELPILEIVKLLLDSGYDGYFSLEWESAWRKEIRDIYASAEEAVAAFVDYIKS